MEIKDRHKDTGPFHPNSLGTSIGYMSSLSRVYAADQDVRLGTEVHPGTGVGEEHRDGRLGTTG